jgi:HK97 gp10 family phage protein
VANLNWHGDERLREIRSELDRRLARAAIVVGTGAKRLLSVAGTGARTREGQVAPAVRTGKKRVYGAFPSKPGEPPRKQTGRLRSSVTHEIGRGIARVGTNVLYGRFLELGTRKMAPRPWLRRALDEAREQVRTILSRPMR